MKAAVFVLIVFAFILSLNQQASALPRFALMAGAKCASCHVNPTGGQMRTEYGVNYSIEKLPLAETKEDDFTFDPKLSDNISIGGDYRGQLLYDGSRKLSSFQAMSATIYTNVSLTKKISFYFKHDFIGDAYFGQYGPRYVGTEVFVLAKVFPKSSYIKGGIFLPDYGWRLDDHSAYTRGGDLGNFQNLNFGNGLIFSPGYRDIGMEAGFNIEDCFITAGVFNGSGYNQPIDFTNSAKAYVAKIEYMGSGSSVNYRVGISGYGYKEYRMGGFTAGLATGDFVLFGEIDWTRHKLSSFSGGVTQGQHTMAAFTELDYRAIQGLWLIGKFEIYDPLQGVNDDDTTPAINSLKRLVLGLEFFPYSFVEIRPQYRINIDKPSVQNDQALVQMHVWF